MNIFEKCYKGGASYCGTPRLKNAAQELDKAIKVELDPEKIQHAYEQLCNEINAVLSEYQKIKIENVVST